MRRCLLSLLLVSWVEVCRYRGVEAVVCLRGDLWGRRRVFEVDLVVWRRLRLLV